MITVGFKPAEAEIHAFTSDDTVLGSIGPARENPASSTGRKI